MQHKRVNIPTEVLDHHKCLPMHLDFCFINGNPYLTTITVKVNYRTAERTKGRGRKQILMKLKPIIDQLNSRGFEVDEYHADNEFRKIE